MGDQTIHTCDDGKKLVLRRIDYGSADMRVRIAFVAPDGSTLLETDDLSTANVCDAAHAFSRIYFDKTKRVVWPIGGAMLHAYEKEQEKAEAEHLEREKARNPDAAANYAARVVESKPATRYFFHPESDSLFTTEDGSRPVGDGLVEEIDEERYLRIKAELAAPAIPLSWDDL